MTRKELIQEYLIFSDKDYTFFQDKKFREKLELWAWEHKEEIKRVSKELKKHFERLLKEAKKQGAKSFIEMYLYYLSNIEKNLNKLK